MPRGLGGVLSLMLHLQQESETVNKERDLTSERTRVDQNCSHHHKLKSIGASCRIVERASRSVVVRGQSLMFNILYF